MARGAQRGLIKADPGAQPPCADSRARVEGSWSGRQDSNRSDVCTELASDYVR